MAHVEIALVTLVPDIINAMEVLVARIAATSPAPKADEARDMCEGTEMLGCAVRQLLDRKDVYDPET